MPRDLYGLVLVGGESRRMGCDKAMLSYDGRSTQIERTAELLQEVCDQVFVSQRKEQSFPTPQGTEVIFDSIEKAKGPLCGILSAMKTHEDADWLVVACDLPNLSTETLQKIIRAYRDDEPKLTAYKSSYDGLPEPLCAIYPSGTDRELLDLSLEIGKSCPRKLLILREASLIEQDDPRSLDNINTTEEFISATQL